MKQVTFIIISLILISCSKNLHEDKNVDENNLIIFDASHSFENALTLIFKNSNLEHEKLKISSNNSICRYFNDTINLNFSAEKGAGGAGVNLEITKGKYNLKAFKWSCTYTKKYTTIYNRSKVIVEKDSFNVNDSVKIYLDAFLVYKNEKENYFDTLKISGDLNFRIRNKDHTEEKQRKENIINEFHEMSINRPDTIKWLELRYLDLKKIPNEIKKFTNLEYLDLEGNKIEIKEFEKIAKLVNLKELIVRKNQLDEFPKIICTLKKLEKLDVWDNNISQIPFEFIELAKLKELQIESNKIKEFPKVLYRLPSLENLYMADNQMDNYLINIKKIKNIKDYN